MNEVHNNMIIANYGSSQGFDTDGRWSLLFCQHGAAMANIHVSIRTIPIVPTSSLSLARSLSFADGSSFYNISDNFMFLADAWKMDYGSVTAVVFSLGSQDAVLFAGFKLLWRLICAVVGATTTL